MRVLFRIYVEGKWTRAKEGESIKREGNLLGLWDTPEGAAEVSALFGVWFDSSTQTPKSCTSPTGRKGLCSSFLSLFFSDSLDVTYNLNGPFSVTVSGDHHFIEYTVHTISGFSLFRVFHRVTQSPSRLCQWANMHNSTYNRIMRCLHTHLHIKVYILYNITLWQSIINIFWATQSG